MSLVAVNLRTIALVQGLYYGLTGLWAVLDIQSFQLVTGPKADLWLVKTVGLLVLVVGIVLVTAGLRQRLALETVLLGSGCCLVLAWVSAWYALKGVIAPIYLLDALLELLLAFFWVRGWLVRKGSRIPHR